jgi:hypothetical protein
MTKESFMAQWNVQGMSLGNQRLANAAWDDATIAERMACADICDVKANSLESKVIECAGDVNEITNLRSAAWLISLCSSEIMERCNV